MSAFRDWPGMIQALRSVGMTDWKIAQAIGYTHPKEVKAIAGEVLSGPRIPRHDIGEALIELYKLMCPAGPVSCET